MVTKLHQIRLKLPQKLDKKLYMKIRTKLQQKLDKKLQYCTITRQNCNNKGKNATKLQQITVDATTKQDKNKTKTASFNTSTKLNNSF